MPNLTLTPVIEVNIISSPVAQGTLTFDLGLIIGDSTVIPFSERVKEYANLQEMLDDGFADTDPEYVAAEIYFSQSPRPNLVAIGAWDTTTPETITACLTDCRSKNANFYGVTVLGATDSEIESASATVEAFEQATILFATSKSADIIAGTAGNLMETLKGENYKRTFAEYSADDYAACATMGILMGLNGYDKPSWTAKFKTKTGIDTDDLSSAQVTAVEGNNGNVYVNRSGYKWIEQGVTPSGIFIDETVGLDMLAERIRVNIANLYSSATKIPQTDGGVTSQLNQIASACDEQVERGFIAPGIWTGQPIGNLQTGDMLPNGYTIIAGSIYTQLQADREARKSPEITVPIKLAGAIHSAVINVYVNR